MASGLRESRNAEGFYLQMHNASSGDLLWEGLKATKSLIKEAESVCRIFSCGKNYIEEDCSKYGRC